MLLYKTWSQQHNIMDYTSEAPCQVFGIIIESHDAGWNIKRMRHG